MKLTLPLSIFVVTFLVGFVLQRFPGLPRQFIYIPDMVVGLVGSIVIVRIIATKRLGRVPLRYLLVFTAFCYVVVCGALVNGLAPGVLFAGLRTYFKYVPLFLIPFAYDYSRRDIEKLFVGLLVLALLQIPVALYERFDLYRGLPSGDVVTGTLARGGPVLLASSWSQ